MTTLWCAEVLDRYAATVRRGAPHLPMDNQLCTELTARGGALIRPVRTSASYRLYRLGTTPVKPGLVRTADGGAQIGGELWALPPAGLGSLLAALPAPMALGSVTLEDGTEVVGFLCEPAALTGALEITSYGGWRAYQTIAAEPISG